MQVEIKLIEELQEPYAIIYTAQISDEIQNIANQIGTSSSKDIVLGIENERNIVLHADEIYMVRIEGDKAFIYCKDKKYPSRKRLGEVESILNKGFMRISKTAIINLDYIAGIEAAFSGMMLIVLKNGCKDYVSRKYLPDLKKYLGI